eukprot:8850909-Ditylum_brightwellii.AAC.1
MWPEVDDHERDSCTGNHCVHPLHASSYIVRQTVVAVVVVDEIAVVDSNVVAPVAATETVAVVGTTVVVETVVYAVC